MYMFAVPCFRNNFNMFNVLQNVEELQYIWRNTQVSFQINKTE